MGSRQTDEETGQYKPWTNLAGRMVKRLHRKAIHRWAEEESPTLDAAREQRGTYFIPNDDRDEKNHEQCQKKVGNEESHSDALQSHHSSRIAEDSNHEEYRKDLFRTTSRTEVTFPCRTTNWCTKPMLK